MGNVIQFNSVYVAAPLLHGNDADKLSPVLVISVCCHRVSSGNAVCFVLQSVDWDTVPHHLSDNSTHSGVCNKTVFLSVKTVPDCSNVYPELSSRIVVFYIDFPVSHFSVSCGIINARRHHFFAPHLIFFPQCIKVWQFCSEHGRTSGKKVVSIEV